MPNQSPLGCGGLTVQSVGFGSFFDVDEFTFIRVDEKFIVGYNVIVDCYEYNRSLSREVGRKMTSRRF